MTFDYASLYPAARIERGNSAPLAPGARYQRGSARVDIDMGRLVAGCLCVFVLVVCGAAPGQSSGPLAPPSPPTQALAAWKDFPANANPRPLIVFGRSVDHLGPAGFSSEPDRKIVWVCNKFVFASGVTLSDTAPARASVGNGGSYPSIGSARAFSELMAARPNVSAAQPQCATSRPFVIKSVRWGTSGFPTDRGSMTMSAWLFDLAEIDGYLSYSAVDPSSFWGGGVNSDGGRDARVSSDGRTLKVPVSNAGPGQCGADYTAAAAESDSAVALAIKRYSHETPGQQVVCTLELRISYITVELQARLGGRVLLDERGEVGSVCSESGSC